MFRLAMDDYKRSLCVLVQDRPLLWDPDHSDYKNKDQRQQTWEDIDQQLPPCRKGATAKEIWTQLNRGYCNASKRRRKRLSDGGGLKDDKQWKFEKAMSFLIAVKSKRGTINHFDYDFDDANDELSEDEESVISRAAEEPIEYRNEDGEFVSTSQQLDASSLRKVAEQIVSTSNQLDSTGQRNAKDPRGYKRKKRFDDDDDSSYGQSGSTGSMRFENSKESPRLNFFKSLMPKVESLSEDQFLDFQIDVLHVLKNHTHPVLS